MGQEGVAPDMPVRRIFDECIVPCVTPEAALRGDDVREQRMYIEETDIVLRKHERVLSALYKHYFMRNPVMNKGKLGLEEWLAFLKEAKLISDDSDAGSGSDCDGWVFDDDGGYNQDEAYELFQWAVE